MPRRQRPYPSDLSDARWELLEPTLTAWRAERRGNGLDIGRPPEHDRRRIMDAILYVDRTGIPRRYLPHDFAPWETVYGYFAAWQKDGVFDRLSGLLRRLVREAEGRDAEPSACILDAQSIKTSANVPAAGQGIDGGQEDRRPQTPHRCRHPRPPPGRAGHRRRRFRQHRRHPRAVEHPRRASPRHEGMGRLRLPHESHRARRPPRNRRGSHPPRPCPEGLQGHSPALGRRTDRRLAHAPPPPRPRPRDPTAPLRSHGPPRDDRPHEPQTHQRIDPDLGVTGSGRTRSCRGSHRAPRSGCCRSWDRNASTGHRSRGPDRGSWHGS